MLKPFDSIVISRNIWPVGRIVNDYANDGTLIFDDSYKIPSICAHMSDELISALLRENSLVLYGVLDSDGRLHMNQDDFNRLKEYLAKTSRDSALGYKRRCRANIDCRCVDYRVREDLKKDFWMKVINCK